MRARRVKAAARGTLTLLCLTVLSVAVLGTRTLVFEYHHGDRQVVEMLLDKISP